MSLPSREAAAGWVGFAVEDAAGTEIGRCARVYADLDTGAPEWLVVERDGQESVLPLVDASESNGRISVRFTADVIAAAPHATGSDGLSTEEEAVFYAHYGVDVASGSDSLLPAGESAPEPEGAMPAGGQAAEAPIGDVLPDLPTGEITSDRSAETASAATPADVSDDMPKQLPSVDVPPAAPVAPPSMAPAPLSDWDAPPTAESATARRALATSGLGAALALLGYVLRQRTSSRPKRTRRVAVRGPARPVRSKSGAATTSALRSAVKTVPRTSSRVASSTGRAAGSSSRSITNAVSATGARGGQALTHGARAASRTVQAAAGGVRRPSRAAVSTPAAARRRPSQPAKGLSRAMSSAATVAAQRTQRVQRKGRRLMGRLTAGLALGAGYVLGARAGRERYEKIKQVSTSVAQRPEVQQVSSKVRSAVNDKLSDSGPARKLGYPDHARWRALRPTGATDPTGMGTSEFSTQGYPTSGTSTGAMPAADPLLSPPITANDPIDPLIDLPVTDENHRDSF